MNPLGYVFLLNVCMPVLLGSNPVPGLVHTELWHLWQTEQDGEQEGYCPGDAHVPDEGQTKWISQYSGVSFSMTFIIFVNFLYQYMGRT